MHMNRWWACLLAVPLLTAGCAVPGLNGEASSAGRPARVKAESDHTVAAKVSFAGQEDAGDLSDRSVSAKAPLDDTAVEPGADGGSFVEMPTWGDAGPPRAMATAPASSGTTGGAAQAPWWRRARDAGSSLVPPAFLFTTATPLPTETPLPSATPWPTATIPPTPTTDPLVAAGVPVRLEVPAIGVDAVVERVGLTSERAMDVPKDWMNVGWYENGPLPGAEGNAVIAGHLDTNTGGPAVFWMLNRLSPGDQVIVTYSSGDRYTFVVQELVEYDHDAEGEVIDTVFGDSLAPNLNLVTCQGVWDYGNRTYNKRLVVFTSLAPELTVRADQDLIRN